MKKIIVLGLLATSFMGCKTIDSMQVGDQKEINGTAYYKNEDGKLTKVSDSDRDNDIQASEWGDF